LPQIQISFKVYNIDYAIGLELDYNLDSKKRQSLYYSLFISAIGILASLEVFKILKKVLI
jgi:hypothetical protein